MFEEHRFIKMIHKGDPDQLKKFLEKNPSFLTKDISYGDRSGNALEAAVFFNQPKIIKYLVTEKGVDVNKGRLYLHVAAMAGSYEAAVTLLELGANTAKRRDFLYNKDAYSYSEDQRLKDLLLPYHQELLQEENLADAQDAQKVREAAEARIAGTWTLASPGEVVHQHQHITDIFNFSTRCMTSIAADLNSGQQLVNSVSFGNVPDKMLEQASAKLKELTAQQQPPENPSTQAAVPELSQEVLDAIAALGKPARRQAAGPRT